MTKEQDLDGNGQASVQEHDGNQQDLADLLLGGADDGVQVLNQEEDADGVAQADQGVVQAVERRPRHEGDGDPEEIAVAVQGPALDELQRLCAEPPQRGPQPQRHEQRVPVDQAGSAAQQLEVVLEVFLALGRELVADGPREEEDHHHGRRDPERPVQVRVAVHRVEKRRRVGQEREDRAAASVEDCRRVDVEELRVERKRPEHALGRHRRGVRRDRGCGGRAVGQERCRIRLDLAARGVALKVCKELT